MSPESGAQSLFPPIEKFVSALTFIPADDVVKGFRQRNSTGSVHPPALSRILSFHDARTHWGRVLGVTWIHGASDDLSTFYFSFI